MEAKEPTIVKKIYFIKSVRNAEPEERMLRHMKNKFKSMDAIRDLFDWHREGRDFTVHLSVEGAERGTLPETALEISPWNRKEKNQLHLLQAIEQMVRWLDRGFAFDITLAPKGSVPTFLN